MKTTVFFWLAATTLLLAACTATLPLPPGVDSDPILPVLTTNVASSITVGGATLGGNITNEGIPPYTERGVVYATTENPTTENNKTIIPGAGTGNFSTDLSDLTPNTTYYVRAYAINTAGTAYGEQVSFKTNEQAVDITMEMVSVQGGTFTMGCTDEQGGDCNINESPAHEVTLSSFSIGKYQVTQAQWLAVMGSWQGTAPSSSYGIGDNYPAYFVSWNDIVGTSGDSEVINGITYYANGFIYKLNQLTGEKYRLPTEAEWEYAARGGNQSAGYKHSGSNTIGDVAWYWDNIPSQIYGDPGFGAQPVGTKAPNELGIYDMSGNVFEWCSDYFSAYTDTPKTNPTGGVSSMNRINRGGGWNHSSTTVSNRFSNWPDASQSYLGFRLVCCSAAEVLPSLTTNAAINITETSAILGGIIVHAGTPAYTERGVVFATTQEPTTANNKTPISGTETGNFSTNVEGLTANTTYYVRAYAINTTGTAYGAQVSFKTNEQAVGVTIEMVSVQGGTFTMGCTAEQGGDCNDNESPTHEVTLSSFSIGKYEVTQAQWVAVMGSWPGTAPSSSYGIGDNYPAYYVSWNDIVGTSGDSEVINGITYYANGFIYKLNQLTGKKYRLPTEAEWEYAARGGNQSKGYTYSGGNNIDIVAWYSGNNSPNGTKPVGTKAPNELGIYDMSGNVFEWCNDWYGDYTAGVKTNPTGPATGSYRVYRGSYWGIGASFCRVAYRNYYIPDYRADGIGFRLVCCSAAEVLPSLTTNSVTNTTATSAIFGGNIVHAGTPAYTERGVVYATTQNPTIANNKTPISGTGTGNFSATVSNLTANTTYYVRAYAIHSTGTEYGAQVSFKTNELPLITMNSQPAATTNVTVGNITGNLSVSASVTQSATLSYQWYSNTTNNNTDGSEISDATSASFTIPTTLTEGTYYYFCEVRATGGAISVRSNVATVNVQAATSVTIEMVSVQGGVFTMGCTAEQGSDCFDNESPAHEVTLSSFSIGKYQVTQAQWVAVMGSNPSYFTGDNLPVEQVSWNDIVGTSGASEVINGITYYANGFIYKLNQLTGKKYRLATEAEWEYAARGGNQSTGYKYSGSNIIDIVAWYSGNNSPNGTKPVGTKAPNELGIYDMSGNVSEWCSDWYGSYTDDAKTNPTGPATGSFRVNRGGNSYIGAVGCRVAFRSGSTPGSGGTANGFRLVCCSVAEVLPSLTTNSVTNTTATSAILGGTIVHAGTPAYTERGIVFATTQNPTTANNKTPISGTGTGNFSTTVSNLTPNTTYYVRAYATNTEGTAYGAQVSFTAAATASVDIEMVSVQGGTFTMGSASGGYFNESPTHQVTLSSFSIGKYLMTQAQWIAVMGSWPGTAPSSSWGIGDNYPAYWVSWNDIVGTSGASEVINGITYYANGFIYKLNQLTGKKYRLPTESEWEYAARGGNQSKGYTYSGSNNIDDVAWYSDNNTPSGSKPVGTKAPNELGIYDMSGNVWEWCSDWHGLYTDAAVTNPMGPESGTDRVYRGGDWVVVATLCRVAQRNGNVPDYRMNVLGFRLACSSESNSLPLVVTNAVPYIAATSATLEGNITYAGTPPYTERGFVYATMQNPTTANNRTPVSGTGTGNFSTTVSGLTPNTLYYVRAYAINTEGTAYGPQVSFTTTGIFPTLTTAAVTAFTASTATLGGNIITVGTPAYTERGVCYSTSQNPTIANNKTPISGTETGNFSTTVSNLTANTTYYVRAYAINTQGTAYGGQESFTTAATASVDIEMVSVQGGTFTMGESGYSNGEVTLSDFSIGKYEVTQAQWEAVMGNNLSYWKGDNLPVIQVSWDDIVGTSGASVVINEITYRENGFVYKLNQMTGKSYRLPTEAEWEYAARGGNQSIGYEYSGSNTIGDVAWYEDNSNNRIQTVGTKAPNELGIYDMSGNVFEWCSDWFGNYTGTAKINPTGPVSGSNRVPRGGAFSRAASLCRVVGRALFPPDIPYSYIGFRLACSSESNSLPLLVTNAATNITNTSATLRGNITYAGTPPYTERGVVYATTGNPTTANHKTIIPGAGTGNFSTNVEGLTSNTTYYVRAYAINSAGTAYGAQVSFKTNEQSVSVTMEMVSVQGGTFAMGESLNSNGNVTLSDFSIGKYEVTQAQWVAVMGSNPSGYKGDNLPVETVSWNDIVGTSGASEEINGITYYANGFIYKLNQLNGIKYRLPTEAEWEYAARGGNQSQGYTYSGSNTIEDVAWYSANNSPSGTKPVGTKASNELGIYDMSGNVWEWCSDWYGSYSSNAKTNHTGPATGSDRVRRGGSWSAVDTSCRVAARGGSTPDYRHSAVGFRLAF